ncbi:MAG: MCE family protein [Chlamydiia bacterium]|nr:MCE family protein [Chlamydiia bacterium]
MPDPAKNILIGLFVIAACFLIVGVLLFLHPTVGDCAQHLRVRFAEIDKINTGTRVSFAGRPVGEVLSITQLEHNREGKQDRYGHVYSYELLLCIDSSVTVYNTDRISSYTSGLLGERSIGITPLPPEKGQELRPIEKDEVLYAVSAGSVDAALEQIGNLGAKAERALALLGDVLDDNKEVMKETLANARDTFDALSKTVQKVNEEDLVVSMKRAAGSFSDTMESFNAQLLDIEQNELWVKMSDILGNIADITDGLNDSQKWQEIVANIHSLTEGLTDLEGRVNESWDRVDEGIGKFSVAMASISDASVDARNLIGDVKEGKGALGKILTRDDFYVRLNTLLGKADTLMNDINHYGLLFHRERGWQRERTKRMTEVQRLDTAEAFRTHFNEEVDGIQTSLSRVHVLLEEAEMRDGCGAMLDKPRFSKALRELLAEVGGLKDSIELYSRELAEEGYGEGGCATK